MARIPKPKSIAADLKNDYRRNDTVEPKASINKPVCPSTLDKAGKAHWDETVKNLDDMGLLSRTDQDAIRLYCEAFSRYVECEEFLRRNGISYKTPNGYHQPYPQRDEMYRNLDILRRYQIEFGLTPSARSRIGIQKKNTDSAWGKFFE